MLLHILCCITRISREYYGFHVISKIIRVINSLIKLVTQILLDNCSLTFNYTQVKAYPKISRPIIFLKHFLSEKQSVKFFQFLT